MQAGLVIRRSTRRSYLSTASPRYTPTGGSQPSRSRLTLGWLPRRRICSGEPALGHTGSKRPHWSRYTSSRSCPSPEKSQACTSTPNRSRRRTRPRLVLRCTGHRRHRRRHSRRGSPCPHQEGSRHRGLHRLSLLRNRMHRRRSVRSRLAPRRRPAPLRSRGPHRHVRRRSGSRLGSHPNIRRSRRRGRRKRGARQERTTYLPRAGIGCFA